MEEAQQPSQTTPPVKRSAMGWLLLIVIVSVIFGVFYILSTKKAVSPKMENSTQAPTTQTTVQPTTSSTSPSSAAVEQITVSGNEFAFTPSTIMLKAGQPVQLTFKNEGKYPHNFTISDLNIQTKTIQSGEEDTISFTPTKTGTFTYVCTVPGHADRGMKGTLTVQ